MHQVKVVRIELSILCMAATPQRKKIKQTNSVWDIYKAKSEGIYNVLKTINDFTNYHKARVIRKHKISQSTQKNDQNYQSCTKIVHRNHIHSLDRSMKQHTFTNTKQTCTHTYRTHNPHIQVDSETKRYVNDISSLGSEQLIACPTRVSSSKESIVDHVYVDNCTLNNVNTTAVIEHGISDHSPIVIAFQLVTDKKKFEDRLCENFQTKIRKIFD